jgi:hypothetical protein
MSKLPYSRGTSGGLAQGQEKKRRRRKKYKYKKHNIYIN